MMASAKALGAVRRAWDARLDARRDGTREAGMWYRRACDEHLHDTAYLVAKADGMRLAGHHAADEEFIAAVAALIDAADEEFFAAVAAVCG